MNKHKYTNREGVPKPEKVRRLLLHGAVKALNQGKPVWWNIGMWDAKEGREVKNGN